MWKCNEKKKIIININVYNDNVMKIIIMSIM